MPVNRLSGMAGIGVAQMGNLAGQSQDGEILRLENLDTDLRPPPGVEEATKQAVAEDDANRYLPFLGSNTLRQAAASLVSRLSGVEYDWYNSTIVSAGGLNGILNVLLAVLEPGDEVLLTDPIYIGLVNRVRLAGGVPVFAAGNIEDGTWRLDHDKLRQAVTPQTKVFLMMSPSMPTGAVFTREDGAAVCTICQEADAWLLYDSAMERILFDDLEHIHPASFPGMAERTIPVGAVSKEYRMIGWRIGWIVAPPSIIDDIGLVNISNVVRPVGIAQAAATVALQAPDSDIAVASAEWQARRDLILQEPVGLPVIKPQGGWSLLMDVSGFDLTGAEASQRLLERGKIAATAITG